MQIAHVSDSHGLIWPEIPDESELVIHSGDGLPNMTRGNIPVEIKFQSEWVENHVEKYKKWLKGKPLIYCQGNHCFISPVEILSKHGIECLDVTNNLIYFKGKSFYGFPFINYIDGEWNHERQLPEMAQEMHKLKDVLLNQKLDCLIAHAPIAGILDLEDGCRYGNTLMANMLNYELDKEQWPKAYCCGHVHASHNVIKLDSMTISNAATVAHLIEI